MTNPAISAQCSVINEKPQIIFIVGPTAVGKTAVALQLAEQINGEIVSCDAMQVYREVNIASAKPSTLELNKVRHHCINVVSVSEEFDVVKYRKLAIEAIEDIFKRKKLPIVVGGSGMYMSVLLDGIFEGASRDEALRTKLEEQIKNDGAQALHDQLQELDPKAASKIHVNDSKRIIRALEVVLSIKQQISQLQQQRNGLWGKYAIKVYGLERPRSELYAKAEERIDAMFKEGLVEEVKGILEKNSSLTARSLIGLGEVQGFLEGKYDLARSKYLLKLHTRHYVKRQMTWFKRDKRINWIMIDQSPKNTVDRIIKENVA